MQEMWQGNRGRLKHTFHRDAAIFSLLPSINIALDLYNKTLINYIPTKGAINFKATPVCTDTCMTEHVMHM